MSEEIYLTPKRILNKSFEVTANGYYALEVDSYLDLICKDYETFRKIIMNEQTKVKRLEEENKALKEALEALKQENAVSQDNVKKLESELQPQVDLYKRISQLEKAVAEIQEKMNL